MKSIAGYGLLIFMLSGMIFPGHAGNMAADNKSSVFELSQPSAALSHRGSENFTFDGQDMVKTTVKMANNVVHLMNIAELPKDSGHTKDGAQYTITSTGEHLKGYIDYTKDGYVIIITPRSPSLTAVEFKEILDAFSLSD
ncbi:Uncharacterised protein [uncultured archaeon]|nr:Uncharacterised protein [uncultured archaeon]